MCQCDLKCADFAPPEWCGCHLIVGYALVFAIWCSLTLNCWSKCSMSNDHIWILRNHYMNLKIFQDWIFFPIFACYFPEVDFLTNEGLFPIFCNTMLCFLYGILSIVFWLPLFYDKELLLVLDPFVVYHYPCFWSPLNYCLSQSWQFFLHPNCFLLLGIYLYLFELD